MRGPPSAIPTRSRSCDPLALEGREAHATLVIRAWVLFAAFVAALLAPPTLSLERGRDLLFSERPAHTELSTRAEVAEAAPIAVDKADGAVAVALVPASAWWREADAMVVPARPALPLQVRKRWDRRRDIRRIRTRCRLGDGAHRFLA